MKYPVNEENSKWIFWAVIAGVLVVLAVIYLTLRDAGKVNQRIDEMHPDVHIATTTEDVSTTTNEVASTTDEMVN